MNLTWLAADLRAAGLDVRETDGWQTRAVSGIFAPIGVLIHDTAGPPTGDAPDLAICRDGRSDLAGPLCQLLIGRSGSVWVIAGGRANHAGVGALAPYVPQNTGNQCLVGIEMENTGTGTEPWPDHQVAVAQQCAAVLLRRLVPAMTHPPAFVPVWGHKEYAPGRKPDPVGIDMGQFRSAVAGILNPPPVQEDDMPGIHQLGAAMATLDQLYRNHRGTAPTPAEELSWAKDFETKLAAGTDLAPTYDYIVWALDNPKG